MKKTFEFGKIAYTNSNRKANAVTITMELRKRGGEETFTIDRATGERTITGRTPAYVELSICGDIWNTRRTDCVCGGQCLDTIAEYRDQLNDPDLFDQLFDLWRKYHLNGMHAGTPEQEQAIETWMAQGNKYDYAAACELLKDLDLYEVNYTGISVGKRYNNEPYKYGHGWIVNELPGSVLLRVEHMLSV